MFRFVSPYQSLDDGRADDPVAPCDAERVPGDAPGGAVTFFGQKKSPKKAHPAVCDPLRCATGATCAGLFAGCAAELTARLRRCVQTTAASQITKHERTCAHATPQTPRRRRIHKGLYIRNSLNIHTGHRCARLWKPNCALFAEFVFAQAKRGNGRFGCSAIWFPDVPIPCGRAEKRSGGRIRARVCLSAAGASSARPRPARASQVARSEAKGHGQQGRLFFAIFLLATQKKDGAPPGAYPGSRPSTRSRARNWPNVSLIFKGKSTSSARPPSFVATKIEAKEAEA